MPPRPSTWTRNTRYRRTSSHCFKVEEARHSLSPSECQPFDLLTRSWYWMITRSRSWVHTRNYFKIETASISSSIQRSPRRDMLNERDCAGQLEFKNSQRKSPGPQTKATEKGYQGGT